MSNQPKIGKSTPDQPLMRSSQATMVGTHPFEPRHVRTTVRCLSISRTHKSKTGRLRLCEAARVYSGRCWLGQPTVNSDAAFGRHKKRCRQAILSSHPSIRLVYPSDKRARLSRVLTDFRKPRSARAYKQSVRLTPNFETAS